MSSKVLRCPRNHFTDLNSIGNCDIPSCVDGQDKARRVMFERSHQRISRYHKLALIEPDQTGASLLQKLASEAEKGILCMAPHALAIRLVPVSRVRLFPGSAWPSWRPDGKLPGYRLR
jgi:hypothetical protein